MDRPSAASVPTGESAVHVYCGRAPHAPPWACAHADCVGQSWTSGSPAVVPVTSRVSAVAFAPSGIT
jgi:hypothetical protein